MKFTQHKLFRIVFVAASTVVIAYIVGEFGGGNILKTLEHIDPAITILAFFLFTFTLLVKAIRFRFILKNKISIKNLFSIVSIHSFWNNVLPFKSGEIMYLYMVNEEKNISSGENVASLLLARVFDLLIVLSLFCISGFFIFRQQSGFLGPISLTLVVSALALGVIILWGIVFNRHKLNNFFSNLSFKNVFLKKIFRILAETFLAFDQVNNFRRLAVFSVLSFSVWILDTVFVWVAVSAGGLGFSLAEAAFIGIFPTLAGLVPINLAGNFGVFESAVTGGLLLLQVGAERALGLSFILHAQIIAFSFTLFVFAFWHRNMSNRGTHDSS